MRTPAELKELSVMRIYLACSIVCGACIGLALLAYHVNGVMIVAASANDTDKSTQTSASGKSRSAMAMQSRDTEKPADVAKRKAPKLVEPTVISRAPEPSSIQPVELVATPSTEQVTPARSADEDEWAGYEPWTPGRTDTYRTVCVRLCDGAFFPISFSTTRDRFKTDAARCLASCGSPAQLFVSKIPSVETEDLIDVHGAAYLDLPNAFKFRTNFDAACTCRNPAKEQQIALAVTPEQQTKATLAVTPEQQTKATLAVTPEQQTKAALAAMPERQTKTALAVTPDKQTKTALVSSPEKQASTALATQDPPVAQRPKAQSQPPSPPMPAPVETASLPAPPPTVITLPLAPASPLIIVKAIEATVETKTPARTKDRHVAVAALITPETTKVTPSEAVSEDAPIPKTKVKSTPNPAARKAIIAPPLAAREKPAKPQQPNEPVAVARKVAPTPPRAVVVNRPEYGAPRKVAARQDGASKTQRSFRGGDYWRLSFWEPQ